MQAVSSSSVYILCIEVAQSVTSLAVSRNEECISIKDVLETNKAADKIHLLTAQVLKEAGISFKDLQAVAISAGPGSYTGLRIAASAAKGYCYTLDIPLIAVPTLQAMTAGLQDRYHQRAFDVFVPMIDARREEVYTCFYNDTLEEIQFFSSLVLEATSAQLFDSDKRYVVFGSGAAKSGKYIAAENITIEEGFIPCAKDICRLAYSRFISQAFEDTAYFEPNYAKAFYSTQNK